MITLPSVNPGAECSVALGWQDVPPITVFTGHVNYSTSIGGRDQGRHLIINCLGAQPAGGSKTTQQQHGDDQTFEKFATFIGQNAGLDVSIHPQLASIHRAYWSISGESFRQWGTRVAKEIGAVFSIQGSQAAFTPVGSNERASGQKIGSIVADAQTNIIRWSLSPGYGFATFKSQSAAHYDMNPASWLLGTFGSAAGGTNLINKFKAPDADQANTVAKSNDAFANRWQQGGYITIIGEPRAVVNGICTVTGVRDGIDGDFRIEAVAHVYTRHERYVTELQVGKLAGAGGDDSGGNGGSSGE